MEDTSSECEEQIDLIIPTYKPDHTFYEMILRLSEQTYLPGKVIIINTEEKYFEQRLLPDNERIEVIHIKKEQFDHGGTRNYGAGLSNAEYIMFMTQDAMPADKHVIKEMVTALKQEQVAAVYGRQLPNEQADVIERYTRTFNYPDTDSIKGKENLQQLGIKTYFCSNVCAAYKRNIYMELGGFVTKTIFNEDMIMASKIIDAGYKIAYASKAKVIHSHCYTNREQFTRNFDLAVSQKQYSEIFDQVKSESEGIRYVKRMLQYLIKQHQVVLIPHFIIQTGFKFLGYQFGKRYEKLPKSVVKKFSMNKSYWN